jgi:hypothetical protein
MSAVMTEYLFRDDSYLREIEAEGLPLTTDRPSHPRGNIRVPERTNEDIRAFSDHIRKTARNRAVLRAMDGEQLREVLRHIPDASGSKAGSRARARRVARHLTVIAAAEKLIARHGAALFAAFEREFESELTRIGKGRTAKAQKPQQPFRFG